MSYLVMMHHVFRSFVMCWWVLMSCNICFSILWWVLMSCIAIVLLLAIASCAGLRSCYLALARSISSKPTHQQQYLKGVCIVKLLLECFDELPHCRAMSSIIELCRTSSCTWSSPQQHPPPPATATPPVAHIKVLCNPNKHHQLAQATLKSWFARCIYKIKSSIK